jgi:S-adenosylmethionine synthetase
LAYAIGQAAPFSVHVDTFGTGTVDEEDLDKLVGSYFDFRPAAILERLQLRAPIYRPTAAYGHFGRPGFPWESTAYASELAAAAHRF